MSSGSIETIERLANAAPCSDYGAREFLRSAVADVEWLIARVTELEDTETETVTDLRAEIEDLEEKNETLQDMLGEAREKLKVRDLATQREIADLRKKLADAKWSLTP